MNLYELNPNYSLPPLNFLIANNDFVDPSNQASQVSQVDQVSPTEDLPPGLELPPGLMREKKVLTPQEQLLQINHDLAGLQIMFSQEPSTEICLLIKTLSSKISLNLEQFLKDLPKELSLDVPDPFDFVLNLLILFQNETTDLQVSFLYRFIQEKKIFNLDQIECLEAYNSCDGVKMVETKVFSNNQSESLKQLLPNQMNQRPTIDLLIIAYILKNHPPKEEEPLLDFVLRLNKFNLVRNLVKQNFCIMAEERNVKTNTLPQIPNQQACATIQRLHTTFIRYTVTLNNEASLKKNEAFRFFDSFQNDVHRFLIDLKNKPFSERQKIINTNGELLLYEIMMCNASSALSKKAIDNIKLLLEVNSDTCKLSRKKIYNSLYIKLSNLGFLDKENHNNFSSRMQIISLLESFFVALMSLDDIKRIEHSEKWVAFLIDTFNLASKTEDYKQILFFLYKYLSIEHLSNLISKSIPVEKLSLITVQNLKDEKNKFDSVSFKYGVLFPLEIAKKFRVSNKELPIIIKHINEIAVYSEFFETSEMTIILGFIKHIVSSNPRKFIESLSLQGTVKSIRSKKSKKAQKIFDSNLIKFLSSNKLISYNNWLSVNELILILNDKKIDLQNLTATGKLTLSTINKTLKTLFNSVENCSSKRDYLNKTIQVLSFDSPKLQVENAKSSCYALYPSPENKWSLKELIQEYKEVLKQNNDTSTKLQISSLKLIEMLNVTIDYLYSDLRDSDHLTLCNYMCSLINKSDNACDVYKCDSLKIKISFLMSLTNNLEKRKEFWNIWNALNKTNSQSSYSDALFIRLMMADLLSNRYVPLETIESLFYIIYNLIKRDVAKINFRPADAEESKDIKSRVNKIDVINLEINEVLDYIFIAILNVEKSDKNLMNVQNLIEIILNIFNLSINKDGRFTVDVKNIEKILECFCVTICLNNVTLNPSLVCQVSDFIQNIQPVVEDVNNYNCLSKILQKTFIKTLKNTNYEPLIILGILKTLKISMEKKQLSDLLKELKMFDCLLYKERNDSASQYIEARFPEEMESIRNKHKQFLKNNNTSNIDQSYVFTEYVIEVYKNELQTQIKKTIQAQESMLKDGDNSEILSMISAQYQTFARNKIQTFERIKTEMKQDIINWHSIIETSDINQKALIQEISTWQKSCIERLSAKRVKLNSHLKKYETTIENLKNRYLQGKLAKEEQSNLISKKITGLNVVKKIAEDAVIDLKNHLIWDIELSSTEEEISTWHAEQKKKVEATALSAREKILKTLKLPNLPIHTSPSSSSSSTPSYSTPTQSPADSPVVRGEPSSSKNTMELQSEKIRLLEQKLKQMEKSEKKLKKQNERLENQVKLLSNQKNEVTKIIEIDNSNNSFSTLIEEMRRQIQNLRTQMTNNSSFQLPLNIQLKQLNKRLDGLTSQRQITRTMLEQLLMLSSFIPTSKGTGGSHQNYKAVDFKGMKIGDEVTLSSHSGTSCDVQEVKNVFKAITQVLQYYITRDQTQSGNVV